MAEHAHWIYSEQVFKLHRFSWKISLEQVAKDCMKPCHWRRRSGRHLLLRGRTRRPGAVFKSSSYQNTKVYVPSRTLYRCHRSSFPFLETINKGMWRKSCTLVKRLTCRAVPCRQIRTRQTRQTWRRNLAQHPLPKWFLGPHIACFLIASPFKWLQLRLSHPPTSPWRFQWYNS